MTDQLNPTAEGQRVPDAKMQRLNNGALESISTAELFNGRNVIVFALPGAFTPTCSSTHLPRYEELADTFKANGVDEIVCVSVNDCFVMDAWGKNQGAEKVSLLADGNGSFSEGMGMLVDKSDLGFGKRSWRYAMLVRDGVIEKLFAEPQEPGDPFKVSDADTMLGHIAPDAKKPQAVSLIGRPGCSHCARAKRALEAAGYEYEEVLLGGDITTRTLSAMSGAATTPQVFVDGELIGTADALEAWLAEQ